MGDYSTTSYGANGGDNGGGWVKGGSQNESTNNKRDYSNDNLRPVTIKQLSEAISPSGGADHFMIDGKETTQITFVGQVRNRSFLAVNHVYKMDDGTGVVEVKMWVDPDAADSPDDHLNQLKEKLVEGSYARVFGQLKEFNGKRHVHSRVIRPITDLNEISHHLLEATYVHLVTSRGAPGDATAGANGTTNGAGHGSGGGMPPGISASAKKVLTAIKGAPQQDVGLHVQMIAQQTGMDVNEVMKAVDELGGHGTIYSTEDEHTWALMDL